MTEPFRSIWLGGFSFGTGVVALIVAVALFVSALRMRRTTTEPEPATPVCCPHICLAQSAADLMPEWNTHA